MKTNSNHKSNGNGLVTKSVRLEFIHPAAKLVAVAGTFNDWRPGATEMVSMGNGRWLKDLTLPPGDYEYRVVVDGEWILDPLARETTRSPFGELNSVLKVGVTCQAPKQGLHAQVRKERLEL